MFRHRSVGKGLNLQVRVRLNGASCALRAHCEVTVKKWGAPKRRPRAHCETAVYAEHGAVRKCLRQRKLDSDRNTEKFL